MLCLAKEGIIFRKEAVYLHIIARIHNDFPTKFGVPRQSGLVDSIISRIVFEPEFRDPNALRGIEGYSHLWLMWRFDLPDTDEDENYWQPTVRPPRLGGNTRVGVFASRSPFRPNRIGLSCVRLLSVVSTQNEGTVLTVGGADLMDGTAIFDIKPYLPFTDSHPDAVGGFAAQFSDYSLEVDFPEELSAHIEPEKLPALLGALSNDPRPSYHNDPERVYGLAYAGLNIRFRVADRTLTVISVEKLN